MQLFVSTNLLLLYFPTSLIPGNKELLLYFSGNMNPSKVTFKTSVHVDQTWLELVMDERNTQANGLSVIVDLYGYSWKIFRWLTPSNLRITSKLLDLYPLRQYKIHVVNTSILINASIKLIWPFLSQRIKDMVRT